VRRKRRSASLNGLTLCAVPLYENFSNSFRILKIPLTDFSEVIEKSRRLYAA